MQSKLVPRIQNLEEAALSSYQIWTLQESREDISYGAVGTINFQSLKSYFTADNSSELFPLVSNVSVIPASHIASTHSNFGIGLD